MGLGQRLLKFYGIGASRNPASSVDQATPGDHGDEGGLGGNGWVELVSVNPEFSEDFLNRVLKFGFWKAAPARERPHQPAESGEAFAHPQFVAGADPMEQKVR